MDLLVTSATADRITRLDAMIDADEPNAEQVNHEIIELQVAVLSGEVTHLSLEEVFDRTRKAHGRGIFIARSLKAAARIPRDADAPYWS